MDIQTSLIYGGIVIVCAVVLFAISIFGIKEKTYDEAIAEQRLIPSEHLLLGRSSKEKSKEKKVKKTAAGKKVKEKPAVEQDKNYQKVVPEVATEHHEKSHVEFEPDAEVISDVPHQEEKKKKKKVKPILMNRDEHSVVVTGLPVLVNHFEESLPKDDLLLKRRMSMENLGFAKPVPAPKGKSEKISVPKPEKLVEKPESVGVVKAEKVEKAVPKSEKLATVKTEKPAVPKAEKAVASKVDKASTSKVEKTVAPAVEAVVVANFADAVEATPFTATTTVVKDQRAGSRKKKSELAALQQMTGDREGVNVSLIVPLVEKAELSRSEIQILIDLLLNKQQNSAEFNSEWIEGRQDPMVKLRKQLAEKEKLLSEEQEASQAFQNKLKELRTELNTDRSRWRQLEEAVNAKQVELQHSATRLQHAQEAHKADKNNFQLQIQQLQAKVAEDHIIMRKLQEDQGQAQGAMQQEIHGQRQQLELTVAHLIEKHKEAEAVFTSQINQLHAQLQEQENVHVAMRNELQNTRENAISRENENQMLREKMNQLNMEALKQENFLKDLSRQNEEMQRVNANLDHRINSHNHLESQMQYEKDQLLTELESVKDAYAKVSDVKGEMARLQTEKDGLATTVKSLQTEAAREREEKERLTTKVSGLQRDSQQLREENVSLAARAAAVATERPTAEGKENGNVHDVEKERKRVEEALQLAALLKQKETEVAGLTSQLNNYKTEISKLSNECEAQREKNNETSAAARLEEQATTKQLLERLLPEVSIAECKVHATWLDKFEASAREALSKLRRSSTSTDTTDASAQVTALEEQVAQLQTMVQQYKAIIQDTEQLLKKLQEGAEETDAELESVREERDRLEQSLEEVLGAQEDLPEMQSQLQDLGERLRSEELEKHDLIERCAEMQAQLQASRNSTDFTAHVHHLQEEKERLVTELAAAQEKDREMTKELTKLKQLQETQHPLDKLNGVNEHHSVATNGSETESSHAEGGSGRK